MVCAGLIDEDKAVGVRIVSDIGHGDAVRAVVGRAADERHVIEGLVVHDQAGEVRGLAGVVVVDHERQRVVRPGHRADPRVDQHTGLVVVGFGEVHRVA